MKLRSINRVLCAVLASCLTSAASASSIQYTASFENIPEYAGTPRSIGVDLAQGGSYQVAEPALLGNAAFQPLMRTSNSISLNGTAIIVFHATDTSDPTSPKDLGQVSVSVPYSGYISGQISSQDLNGLYNGTGSSATSSITNANAPPLLLDLLAHPDQIHLSAYMTGGYRNYLLTTMTIDPQPEPVAVPEPSVLATLVVGLGGLVWRGFRRSIAS
jgi:hypothetical protein